MKALLYCTKAKPYLLRTRFENTPYMLFNYVSGSCNGKIVAECEILNGKKDIEVRSQVLNCMKERR